MSVNVCGMSLRELSFGQMFIRLLINECHLKNVKWPFASPPSLSLLYLCSEDHMDGILVVIHFVVVIVDTKLCGRSIEILIM
jgi:hypothetical protein